MASKLLPIGTYQYANEQAGSRKLVNCTAEQATPDSGNQIVLRRMPGIDDFATAGSQIRGQVVLNGVLYVVSGELLYSVNSSGVATSLGAIPGSNRVSMSENGTTMVIVTNPEAYQSDGGAVSQISDPVFAGFGGASDVDYMDGYFIFTAPNSRTSFVSGLNALTFNALDFTTIDGATDNLVGLIVDHREIIYLKEKSTEIWYNAANPVGFPMSRSPNGFLEIGCASRDTAAKIGGAVYWLANDNTVRQLSGARPGIISSVGISKFIDDPSQAYGFAYTFEDKFYYVLAMSGATIEYDIMAKEWHNRETFTRETWNVLSIVEAYGSSIALNNTTGQIGKLNSSTREEWGGIQKIAWTYQEIASEGKRVLHDRFELRIGTGVGLTSGQGSDPLIELLISDDGGKQFYNFETRSLGKKGDYLDRVFWNRLGSAYNRVYRCEMTDPVDLITFGTSIEVRGASF